MDVLEQVTKELLSWPGVTSGPHRFGGTEFRVNGREMGHVHGSRWADLPFPVDKRNELVEKGVASPHHVLPHSGWVTFYIEGESAHDIETLIELFKMQYERLAQQPKNRDKN